MIPRILVVDDAPALRFTLRTILSELPATVIEAEDGQAALDLLATQRVELIVSDLRMPRLDGMALLAAVQAMPEPPPFILITAHGSERTAVEAMKRGAADYFRKPFDAADIERVARRTLHMGALDQENRQLRARLSLGQMVFESEAMLAVAGLVDRIRGRDVTVLIEGETGTGKELVARAIVDGSSRSTGPFIRFNCAALPADLVESELFGHVRGAFTGAASARKGLFRAAHGGTLLLDEVDSLAPRAQASLLRVLQERVVRPVGADQGEPVDVRIIAITGRPLKSVTEFRPDLYYRLNVVHIHLPPLRARPADIRPLAHHFAAQYGEQFGLGSVTLDSALLVQLEAARWLGNARELQHTIERLVALSTSPLITACADGGAESSTPLSLKDRVAAYERGIIVSTLASVDGNQSACARALDINRATLISKLDRYGVR
jgi:DNA-binding NtrC family response regulator